jgi:hypothetical protein
MLLFIDESGTDHRDAPYEVLAGVAIRERNLWPLIQAIRAAEREYFGLLLRDGGGEFKARKLLKRKVFRFARQGPFIEPQPRVVLTTRFLEKGAHSETPYRDEFTAYGQATLAFVEEVYALCGQFGVKAFASIVDLQAPRPDGDFLRKDYAYLFERFFYYLEDISQDEMGVIVFDELDRALCRRLLRRMEDYFLHTHTGRTRSSRIIPEPFFVHSDLTTAVQLADLVAYSLNWGLRLNRMECPTRLEMEAFGQMAFELRYIGQRPGASDEQIWPVYGITYIDDLRPREERQDL